MEIERKFLVNKKKELILKFFLFKNRKKVLNIQQGYLNEIPLEFPSISFTKEEAEEVFKDGGVCRVRIQNNEAYLTVKGKTVGISRIELEDKIPYEYGKALIYSSGKKIVKNRYEYIYKGKKWEIDKFLDKNKGLILCEIELESEDESFEKPCFVGEEVSENPKYYNNNLC